MGFRRATLSDSESVERLLCHHSVQPRLAELVRAALTHFGNEYIAGVSGDPLDSIAVYGMVAGTLTTGELYGILPISQRSPELLSFAAHDLKKHGAERIIAEFPDTDEFKPYRDVLLESGYDPTGLVEDFYRDGIAMVIFTRKLTA